MKAVFGTLYDVFGKSISLSTLPFSNSRPAQLGALLDFEPMRERVSGRSFAMPQFWYSMLLCCSTWQDNSLCLSLDASADRWIP
jgi:hypothetical protein